MCSLQLLLKVPHAPTYTLVPHLALCSMHQAINHSTSTCRLRKPYIACHT